MTTRAIGALALVAAAALEMGVHAQSPAAGRGIIVGRIVDGTRGDGVVGAVVTLTGGPTAARSGAAPAANRVGTDARGNFAFASLPAGTYSLTVTKLGYADSGHGVRRPGGARIDIPLADGQRVTEVSVRIWKFASISGTVLDDAGEPVVGVVVRALRWSFVAGRRRLTPAGQAATDDRGIYRVATLLPGEYVTVLTSTQTALPATIVDAYSRDPGNVAIRSAIVGATTVMPQSGSAQSQQVDGMVITRPSQAVVQPDAARNGPILVVATTFHPSAPATAQAGAVTLTSGEHKDADIRLSLVPTVRVAGTLTGPAGPAALQAVRLVPRWSDDLATDTGFEAATTITDAEGRFTFLGVTPGQCDILRSIQAPRPGPSAPAAPGTPAAGPGALTLYALEPITVGSQNVSMSVTLRTGLRVSGRVTFIGTSATPGGDRLRQVPIVLEPADGKSIVSVPPGQVDATGAFSTYGVPPGRYFVRVGSAPPGWTLRSVTFEGRDVADRAFDLKDGDAAGVLVTFSDTPPQLTGTVRTARGGLDADVSVIVFPVEPDGWIDVGINPRRLRTARVTSAAAFSFSTLPAGDYFIAAIPDEDAGAWPDPKFLETISRRATRVRLADGDRRIQDLTTIR